MKEFLHAKLHRVHVTEADLDYVGSITIDENLLKISGIEEGQKVLVVSADSGVRLETYVIKGESKSGVICMNGPAAHLIKKGETVIVMAFQFSNETIVPTIVFVDENNQPTSQ